MLRQTYAYLMDFRQREIGKFIVFMPALSTLVMVAFGLRSDAFFLIIFAAEALVMFSLACLLLWSFSGIKRPIPWFRIALLMIISGIYMLALGIKAFIGKLDVDSILYHIEFGVAGFDTTQADWIILACVVTWFILVLSTLNYTLRSRFGHLSSVVIIIAMIALNPVFGYGASYLGYQIGIGKAQTHQSLQEFYQPVSDDVMENSKKNIIIIYLEGLERTYNNETFKNAYGGLENIAAEGLEFTNVDEISSTTWSVAGMIASQCGVPLLRHGLIVANLYHSVDAILPNTTCIGDLLSGSNYTQVFLKGGDAQFGGIAKFYQSHTSAEIIDLLQMPHISPNDRNPWGIHDGQLFEVARQKLPALEASGQPYSLIIETVGPHGPEGFISKSCRKSGQNGTTDNILEAVECTGNQTADFVRFVQDTVDMDNTLVVLLSDHLAHGNNVSRILQTLERRNTVIFIGAGIKPGVNDKLGSMIDVYPTILEMMGVKLKDGKANLGVSLLSGNPSLLEMIGMDALNKSISFDRDLSKYLWKQD